jgi:pyridoxal phosphate enzyme (YggS family)
MKNQYSDTISERLAAIRERMDRAAVKCGRNPAEIKLVAVSKTIPAEKVKPAIDAGAAILGENYIQECRDKFNELATTPVSWHFIGHLQRNKAKYAVRIFDLIHTVDSFTLAKEIDKRAAQIEKTQAILVQVNISQEETKSGISVDNVLPLIEQISTLKQVTVNGLMTMPPFFDEPESARPYFQKLRLLRDQISKLNLPQVSLQELSMGMTGDFEVAIEEGATLVRIGTAIFGARY